MSDAHALARTCDALEIVFTAPLWPDRAKLSESGQALHDLIVADAKGCARAVADGAFDTALRIVANWSAPLNRFIDTTLIEGDEHAARMIRVYRHYAEAVAGGSGVLLVAREAKD